MRNTSENPEVAESDEDDVMRTTFEVPRSLVESFRLVARRNNRTLSGELRQRMVDAVGELDAEQAPTPEPTR